MSVSSVTSEALQAKLRQLLPSQQGFGTDISASDTIIPIIDLTESAEGSSVAENLQTAIAFGNQTAFNVANTTSTLINTAGFYRVFGTAIRFYDGATAYDLSISLTDGLASKEILNFDTFATGTAGYTQAMFDFVVYLNSGESLTATSSNVVVYLTGSTRQIATVTGELVQPTGFTPQ